MRRAMHLARRFAGSWSRRPPSDADVAWAWSHLLPREATLWNQMSVADRRHSIEVARRFVALLPDASPAQVAGALLHDVGKIEAQLGTMRRVVATVVGARTRRFRAYHEHEAIGARLLTEAGSDPATIELVQPTGTGSGAGAGAAAAAAGGVLRAADHI